MTQVPVHPAEQPGPAGPADQPGPAGAAGQPGPARAAGQPEIYRPVEGNGPIERVMSTVIRKLSWSRLSQPRVAVAVSAAGLLLGLVVGATAPNAETLPIRLPLSSLMPSLDHTFITATAILYLADILACLGLAGMLWAHSQGWRPDPRHLMLASAGVIAVMVSLTPVGSSDTASYAAYGRIASLGGDPYTTSPAAGLAHTAYLHAVGTIWQHQVSVYGPFATVIQSFAAWVGGANPAVTIWVLMILNGATFLAVGWLLLKTSDDPVRAALFWTANPVLIQQLVGGGHLDTFVAAAAICAIQVARRLPTVVGDVLVGVLIGFACGIKIYAVLIALGLVWPMLRRREWMRTARLIVAAVVTLALGYSIYGFDAIKPVFGGLKLVTLPSPWKLVQLAAETAGVSASTIETVISALWPLCLLVVAWCIHRRIASDQPLEVVAPFALVFAWILVAPWVFAWYTAVAWAALTQVPRNRMTRWLTIVTVLLALFLSSGGQAALRR